MANPTNWWDRISELEKNKPWWAKALGVSSFAMPGGVKNPPYAGATLSPYAAGILQQTGGVPFGAATNTTGTDIQNRISKMAPRTAPVKPPIPPPFPGGAQQGQVVTMPDGSTGFYSYDANGQPQFNRLTNPTGQGASGETDSEKALKMAQAAYYNAQAQGKTNQPPMYSQWGSNPYDNPDTTQQEGQFNPITGQWEPPPGYTSPFQQAQFDWQKQQADMQNQLQQQQFSWQKEQFQLQQEADKAARLANLRANPASWLEYASASGQTPTVQAWMKPLAAPGSNLEVGSPLTQYNASGPSMGLSPLLAPSAQYMSRIAPSSQQQYAGYQQALTGATPQDTSWLLNQSTAPGGNFGGLRVGR
jgi:hypothetical protein